MQKKHPHGRGEDAKDYYKTRPIEETP
ncbi:hypothetical protein BMETH_11351802009, partial [methanotrophic bacterial endosymbiont of Bathymodiolus sp.]